MKLRLRNRPAEITDVDLRERSTTTQFVGASEPVKKRNLGGMALSLLAIVLGTLLFVFFFGGGDVRDPVVGMQRSVAEGQLITEADIVQVEIAVSAQSDVIAWENRGALIGQQAATMLPAGALPNSASGRQPSTIPAGFGEIGIYLDLGVLPSQDLRRGDRLNVVVGTGQDASLAATSVEIRTVTTGTDKTYLTVLIPSGQIVAVAAAVNQNDFRLVRVDQ